MTSDRERFMLRHERKIWKTGVERIAGIDEAGRGPLAGPVVAAAVVFPPGCFLPGVDDSKRLSEQRREELYPLILREATAVGVGIVDHAEIDRLNILNATFKAMHLAVAALQIVPDHLLIDGHLFRPAVAVGEAEYPIPFTTLVGGDAVSFSVAAASVVAKVTRDRMMCELDRVYPGYGFSRNKGYATREHRDGLRRLGICPVHRRTFAGPRQLRLIFPEADWNGG